MMLCTMPLRCIELCCLPLPTPVSCAVLCCSISDLIFIAPIAILVLVIYYEVLGYIFTVLFFFFLLPYLSMVLHPIPVQLSAA